MSLKEVDVQAIAGCEVETPVLFKGNPCGAFAEFLKNLHDNPDELKLELGSMKERYRAVVLESPDTLSLLTPLRASAMFLKYNVQDPIAKAATSFPDKKATFLEDFATGVSALTYALIEAEGSARRGVMQQVHKEIVKETEGFSPEAKKEHVEKSAALRLKVARRRLERYKLDRQGGVVLMGEYSDILDLSNAFSPYEGVKMYSAPFNKTNVEGAIFGIEVYREVFPRAKAMFGEGIVIKSISSPKER